MGGAFGVDPQHTRTVIALAEGTHVRSVGDGRRHLVPNACGPDGRWGSPAAEQQLRDLDDDRDDRDLDDTADDTAHDTAHDTADEPDGLAGHLLDWRCDPLGTPFLRGLRHRLDTYVGRTARSRRRDEICLVAADDGTATERCAEAGLHQVTVVAPTDALVCRWLGIPRADGPFEGRVVAVACGETCTDVAAYEVIVDPGPAGGDGGGPSDGGRVTVTAVPGAGRAEAGFGALSTMLADRVLQRTGEGVAATALLTVLDGTWEYAAELAEAGPDDEVVWDKSLAGRMYDAVRLSPRAVEDWSVAVSARDAVTGLVRAVADRRSLLLVGGIGATWPVAADAVADLGTVWQSTTPAHDLAVGAARWPQLRGLFTGPVPRPRAAPPAAAVRVPAPAAPVDHHRGPLDHLPPWERDL